MKPRLKNDTEHLAKELGTKVQFTPVRVRDEFAARGAEMLEAQPGKGACA
jgi:hypothetical protein